MSGQEETALPRAGMSPVIMLHPGAFWALWPYSTAWRLLYIGRSPALCTPGKFRAWHLCAISVHPGNFSEGGCPWVANVGEHNGIFFANAVKVFGKNYADVKWYYNWNQQFQEKYEGIEDVILKNEKY